jgi:DNA mismatch repair protein MutL
MSAAKKMLPVYKETLDYEITGYIGRPEVTRSSGNFISTIINGRYIKNYPLRKAVIEGYHTLLPIGKYPLVVLKIQMAPILVDVNVHPTKLEVRFSKDKELYETVKQTIQEALRQETLIPEVEYKEPKQKIITEQAQFSFSPNENSSRPKQAGIQEERPPVLREDKPPLFTKPASAVTGELPPIEAREKTETQPLPEETPKKTGRERIPEIYPIGQLHGTYILGQNENGFYMIDQHAAQERIKYEFYRDKLGKPVQNSQQLLIPLTFEFSNQEALLVEAHREELENVGLFLEPFGGRTYVVRSHPSWFPKGLEEEVIQDLIHEVIKEERVEIEKIREEAAITMACKRSIKANHHLQKEDMFRLLEDLRETADPFTCPHGRPIIVHFSTYEIEKMFKRIM